MDKYLGKRLDGRYEMRELIGVGGMAYVYKAYDSVDDRTVAVKILRDEFLTKDEFVRRFRNESKAIAILNHPNIVKVLDVGFGEKLQYIVMEYIDGITLKEYLDQRKDIRWKEAVHFTVQILRALQHAHDKGIVHRDIKPQNIMLLSDGTIKVTDFGIARLTRSEMQATAVGSKAIGSVHYISPEQARGEITDEKTDLYSVGIMLYEMLTGRLPFEADNAVSVAIMQMQSEATVPHLINEEIPEGLEQITLKAMQKDTSKRYQSAAEMLSDFDEFKRNPSIKFEYTYFEDETPTRYVDAITRIRGDVSDEAVEEKEERKSKGKLSTVAILGVVAAAIVLVAGIFMALWSVLNREKRQEIEVDQFVGLSYIDEVPVHANINNYEIVTETEYNADYPEGYVCKQDPAPGTKIKMKGRLVLYISKGSRLEKVPDIFAGESVNMVRSRLEKAGFIVDEVEESSTECKAGTVIRLSPESGEEAQYGSVVTMYVSSGEPKAEPITMSNVVGVEVGSAIDLLVSNGFSRSKIKTEYVNDTAAKDTVIAVTPDNSEPRLPDTEITLTVSTGFRNVEVKVDLPMVDEAIDLQFYIAGKFNSALSAEHSGIKPKLYNGGKVVFTVTETIELYTVSIAISLTGANQYEDYVIYEINGATGTAVLKEKNDFQIAPPTTSTQTQAEPTDTTQTPTETTATSATNNAGQGAVDSNDDGLGTGEQGEGGLDSGDQNAIGEE